MNVNKPSNKETNFMFFTSYFAHETKKVMGGVGYRYAGLYGSMVKILLQKPAATVFWYSHNDSTLRTIDKKGIIKKKSFFSMSIMQTIGKNLKNNSNLVIILAFSCAFPGVKKSIDYFLSLSILKIFSLSKSIKLVVDDFDPPVDSIFAFNTKPPSSLRKLMVYTLEFLTLKFASYILAVNGLEKQNLTRRYHLKDNKFLIAPNGSLVKRIPYVKPATGKEITILYAGSAMECKEIDKLVQTICKLKTKGLKIKFVIAGLKLIELPEWVINYSYYWPVFVKKVLIKSDICVIPYPQNKVAFNITSIAKLFDYMGAGKPVISTDLDGVKEIIKPSECGLVAKDWDEFGKMIETLYYNREYAQKLGINGRKVVEKYYDYDLLAKSLIKAIFKMF